VRSIVKVLCIVGLFAAGAMAQDAVKTDPKHYSVEFENEDVRVLRIKYGPKERSIMHSHPKGVVIAVTDANGKFTMPDGSVQNNSYKAGQVSEAPGGTHLPENTSDQPFELILVEIKAKPETKATAAKKP
jgi:quercetin dioxygenase-like cupin family protein